MCQAILHGASLKLMGPALCMAQNPWIQLSFRNTDMTKKYHISCSFISEMGGLSINHGKDATGSCNIEISTFKHLPIGDWKVVVILKFLGEDLEESSFPAGNIRVGFPCMEGCEKFSRSKSDLAVHEILRHYQEIWECNASRECIKTFDNLQCFERHLCKKHAINNLEAYDTNACVRSNFGSESWCGFCESYQIASELYVHIHDHVEFGGYKICQWVVESR
jgi:hypothetical protein